MLLLLLAGCLVQQASPGVGECGECHSADASEGLFRAPGGETDLSVVGAHFTHLAGGEKSVGMECRACHPVPSTVSSALHLDGVVQIEWGTVARTNDVDESYDGTCTVWCHGAGLEGGVNTSPDWFVVDGTEVVCGSCHSLPPPPPHPADDACHTCHDASIEEGPVVAVPELHINGEINEHPE